jgi:hypothetical protein
MPAMLVNPAPIASGADLRTSIACISRQLGEPLQVALILMAETYISTAS